MEGPTGRLEARRARLSPTKQALLDRWLRGGAAAGSQGIPPRTQREVAELSFAQQRLWMLERLSPGEATYNVPTRVRLSPPLEPEALARALRGLVRRHEVLRTAFTEVEGQPRQRILPELEVPLRVVDLRGLAEEERHATAARLEVEQTLEPFELTRPPLLRACLLWLGEGEQRLLLTLHHIITDGWSMGLLFRELNALYEAFTGGRPAALPALPIQYADFATWQRERLRGGLLESRLGYWKQRLAGLRELSLPTDRPRLAGTRPLGAQHVRVLPRPLSEALKALSRREGVTLFMTLLASLDVLLARWVGQDDVVVGAPAAGRDRAELENLIGFFVNTLVLRTDVSGNPPFRELLRRVREVTLGAYTHQELPFEVLVEALSPAREPGRPPLFQVFFNLLNFADESLARPEAGAPVFSPFDLTVYAGEQGEAIPLVMVYRTDLFDAATPARLLEHWQVLLEGLVADPDQRVMDVSLVSEEERRGRRERARRGRPEQPVPEFTREDTRQSLPARFAWAARRYAERLAVRTPGCAWTYAELDGHGEAVARRVLGRCGGGEGRVALLFPHDERMVAAILGTLKAGKSYVPLDTGSPRERLAYILRDAQVGAILTSADHLGLARELAGDMRAVIDMNEPLPPGGALPLPQVAPDSLAYLLYTSGSTGQPKGVMQSHRNVLGHLRAYTHALGIGPEDRLSLVASYGFDAAVMDLFGALLNGAALCPFDVREGGLTGLATWLEAQAITLHHSTPSLFRQLAAVLPEGRGFPALRRLVLGGEEALRRDVELVRRHFSERCVLVNGLGPTESTLALQYFVDAATELHRPSVPVGFPVEDTEAVLVDEAGREVELCGGVGELVLRGPYVALGYWRRPEETRAAFGAGPGEDGRRSYRTGDLGRLLADGSIEYVGRRDAQVKVRGVRIEPGEVEARLREHPSVREAVVVAREDARGERRLVAFLVPAGAPEPEAGGLRHFLRERLPAYLVPSAFVWLEALPLTPTGKVDRRALPSPDMGRAPVAFVAPASPEEHTLAALWCEVLGVDRVGRHDDFFELGGHSLHAMQLASRIREAFQVELPPRRVFELPTVAVLAELISGHRLRGDAPSTPAIPRLSREAHRTQRDEGSEP